MSAARARKTVEGRVDPKPRLIENNLPGQRLLNANPDRHYIWANESSGGEMDVSAYLAMAEGLGEPPESGYRCEEYDGEKASLRVAIGAVARKGENFRFRGHVLMSCPKAFKLYVDSVGEMGNTGQRGADAAAARAKKRKGSYEDLSDIGGRGISVQSKNALEGLPEEE